MPGKNPAPETPPQESLVLILRTDDGRETEVRGPQRRWTVGRDDTCQWVYPDSYISGEHVLFEVGAAGTTIRDLSRNGTFLSMEGGKPVHLKQQSHTLSGKGSLRLGKPDGREIRFEVIAVTESESRSRRNEIFDLALSRIDEGSPSEGASAFEQLIEMDSRFASAYRYAAHAHHLASHYTMALARYEQYLLFCPSDTWAMTELGKVYEMSGDTGRAANLYRQVLAMIPQHQEASEGIRRIERLASPLAASGGQRKDTRDLLSGSRGEQKTRHFILSYGLAEHGRMVVDVLKYLESAYEEIGSCFDHFPRKKVPVELALHPGEAQDHGKFSDGKISLFASSGAVVPPSLEVAVRHEYVHFLLWSIAGNAPEIPWWMHEGLAQVLSQGEPDSVRWSIIRAGVPLRPNLKDMDGANRFQDETLRSAAYGLAYLACAFLLEYVGMKRLPDIVRQIARNARWEEGMAKANVDIQQFELAWHKALDERLGHSRRTVTLKSVPLGSEPSTSP